MKREQNSGSFLSAVFVDYDNIYMSLKRKSDEAAKRFAKDASLWIKAIETGSLITPTNGPGTEGYRRIVMNRCYGNPVPRRNQSDNSTDMSSFPFVRHNFLRAGFEIVDCPPLTAQLKNSSDIRMVMDVRDYLTHATYFDEFVILSGDADFTPVLHRLRAHARRTVIFANDNTAAPYTAICDGEIRESDLIALLLEGRIGSEIPVAEISKGEPLNIEAIRRDIIADVTAAVRSAQSPVPLEVLADRAVRMIGHEKTIGTQWAGAGGFRELLAKELPDGLRLSGEPPYVVIDSARHITAQPAPIQLQQAASAEIPDARREPRLAQPTAAQPIQQQAAPIAQPLQALQQQAPIAPRETFVQRAAPAPSNPGLQARPASAPTQYAPVGQQAPIQAQQEPAAMMRTRGPEPLVPQAPQHQPVLQQRAPEPQTVIQQSIARIHEACQAPPLAPPEYRILFEAIAQEINENGLVGAQTILNITQRVHNRGIDIRRDDVRFVLEVVSEADPWFEQGASANLFAGRFRNFVVARCRSQGLNLSADELDLIEAWFAGSTPAVQQQAPQHQQQAAQQLQPQVQVQPQPRQPQHAAFADAPPQQPVARPAVLAADTRNNWSLEEGRQYVAEQRQQPMRQAATPVAEAPAEDFPRIVRTRLRG